MVLLAALAGCGKGDGSAVSAGGNETKAAQPAILGHYKGKIEMPKKADGKEDPFAKMGEAMADMMAGMMSLEIKENNRFLLTVMIVPVEGKVEINGKDITLTPELIMGMTPEEAKKQNPKNEFDGTPLKGTISDDGKTIRIAQKKPEEGTMVFEREAETKVGAATVKSEEKALVGQWKGTMEAPTKTAEEKKMMESFSRSLALKLNEDNTYVLDFVFKIEGKWSLEGKSLKLTQTKVMGMDVEDAEKQGTHVDQMSGTLSDDGKEIIVVGEKPEQGKMIFRR